MKLTNIEKRIHKYLKDNCIDFISYYHNPVKDFTELADQLDLPLRCIVKSVLIRTAGSYSLAIVPGNAQLDKERLQQSLRKDNVNIAEKEEISVILPDLEYGMIPPTGQLFGIQVYTDRLISRNDFVVFSAGTPRNTIKIKFSDYRKLEKPVLIKCCKSNTVL